jgi:hypothetical protein
MAQIIKPKRRHTSGAPTTSDLEPNEMAINTADFNIYVRDESNNILKIGGVQSPMNEDLDVNHFHITDTGNPTSEPPMITFGAPVALPRYTTDEANALMTLDPQYCVVGRTYKITTPGDTDWGDMGATAGSGGNFLNIIFTCTEAAPSGTTGGARLGPDSTLIHDEFEGMLIFNLDANDVQHYYNYGWLSI